MTAPTLRPSPPRTRPMPRRRRSSARASSTSGSTCRSGSTAPLLRIAAFDGTTVPALVLDGRRRQTTKAIACALDVERPEPRLVPADPAERARVEAVETRRRIPLPAARAAARVLGAPSAHGSAVDSYLEGSHLILPRVPFVKLLAPADHPHPRARSPVRATRRCGRTSQTLPGLLDRIDALDRRGRARRRRAQRRRLPGRDEPWRC